MLKLKRKKKTEKKKAALWLIKSTWNSNRTEWFGATNVIFSMLIPLRSWEVTSCRVDQWCSYNVWVENTTGGGGVRQTWCHPSKVGVEKLETKFLLQFLWIHVEPHWEMKAQRNFRRLYATSQPVETQSSSVVQGGWMCVGKRGGGEGWVGGSTCWSRKRAERGSLRQQREGSRSQDTLAGEPLEKERQSTSAADLIT